LSLANVGAESMIETVRGIGYRLLELPMTDSRPV
jgi:DNA-binding response OmpR family regulator